MIMDTIIIGSRMTIMLENIIYVFSENLLIIPKVLKPEMTQTQRVTNDNANMINNE